MLFNNFKKRINKSTKHYILFNSIGDVHANSKLLLFNDFLLDNVHGKYVKKNIPKIKGISNKDVIVFLYKINSNPNEVKHFLKEFEDYIDKQRELLKDVMKYSIAIFGAIYFLINQIDSFKNLQEYTLYFCIFLLCYIWYSFVYKMLIEDNIMIDIMHNYIEDILIEQFH
ncbi:hypothetical protein [Apilactobacillus timberlakei]|uniref:hypothetical protein n=1 Tax=Apilactobacillus timberlakei TaxID=2008380 RepID=UPI001128BB69|nr:hypothetical protein [Apilactobacillus timberlakei]TPR16691.1 hypothetical protein DYZ95_07565 [Apilactobacillus timberlakei]